jgi:hypothetical protein
MDLGELKAKFNFWYVRKFFKLDKKYTFMFDMGNPKSIAIKLLGKYEGVVIEFDNIKVGEGNQLTFDINTIANPNLKNIETKSFIRFTRNVMRSIIIGSIENIEKEKDETRNVDLVEPAEERSVHEEESAFFEERVPERKSRKKALRGNKKVHPKV